LADKPPSTRREEEDFLDWSQNQARPRARAIRLDILLTLASLLLSAVLAVVLLLLMRGCRSHSAAPRGRKSATRQAMVWPSTQSEFDVDPYPAHHHRAPVAVVRRVVDELDVGGDKDMLDNFEEVIGFNDILQGVMRQFPIADDESITSGPQMFPMIVGQAVDCY
jgi:hypothetical protein